MRCKYFFLTVLGSLLCLSMFAQTKKPFIRFEENGKYGLVDTSGKVIIEGFDDLEKESGGFIRASKNDVISVLNDDFKVLFQGKYKSISAGAVKNQYIVEKDGKYGVVGARYNIIIPFEYDNITNISAGYYEVRMDKLRGILNAKGKIVIPIRYKSITAKSLNKNVPIMVEDEDGKRLINLKNRVVMSSFCYDNLNWISDDFMIVNNDWKKFYLLNAKGEVIEGPFDRMYYFKDEESKKDFIQAERDGLYLIYDSKRLDLIGTYDFFYGNQVDLTAVKKDGKYGFLNGKGELLIAPQYDEAYGFMEGLAPVIMDGKWGVINEKNEVVIPFQFVGYIGPFKNGVAEYRKGTFSKFNYTWFKNGLINSKGEILAEPIYREIEYLGGNKAIVVFGNDKYLYDFVKKEKIKKLEGDNHIYSIER